MKTESVLDKFQEFSKLIDGYNQWYPVERALGFKSGYDVQTNLGSGYSHRINAGDVEAVVNWLFEQGFDIVKLPSSIWFIENQNQEWMTIRHEWTKDPLLARQFDNKAIAVMYSITNGIHNSTVTEHQFTNP